MDKLNQITHGQEEIYNTALAYFSLYFACIIEHYGEQTDHFHFE